MQIINDNPNFTIARRYVRVGNDVTALEYYTKAAEEGFLPAMVACGQYYLYGGKNIAIDIEKAKYWLQKAATFDNVVAMNNLGYIYEAQNDFELAMNWYKKAAESGDITAMMNLSGVYRVNYKDRKAANFWVKKAESCTDLKSVVELAKYYSEASAIRNNIKKAIAFYEKAVEMGDIDSLTPLGNLYFHSRNFEAAENCYFRAAKSGDVEAMANLGFMLIYSGDFEIARRWIKKAIEGGNLFALRVMGDLYAKYKQYPCALRWYRKAAAAGEFAALQSICKMKKLLKTEKADYKLKLRSLTEF